MSRLFGAIVAGGMLLGHAASAPAQVSLSIGNPFTGGGFALSTPSPYGLYGFGANGYSYPYGITSGYSSYYPGSMFGATTYSSGYSGYVAPGTTYFGTGYVAPRYYGYSYGAPAYYGTYVPSYGYGYGMGRRAFLRGYRRGWW